MKNKLLIITAVSLLFVLLLIIANSCNIAEQYNEMQSQNQLQIYSDGGTGSSESNPSVNDDTSSSSEQQNGTNDPADSPEDQPGSNSTTERTDPKAPDFTVYDVNGNAVKLSDFFGKPIVLNFWASWCGPCQSEMPAFQNKYLELGNDIQFLMVNLTGGRETVESAKKFIANSGYSFPVFFDSSYSASDAYATYSIPVTYFIDAEGYMIARAVGAINADVLQQGIDLIK